ncbi:MAG: DNA replication/repair protein RecF [Clostridia bacterium]|nr:DNA replication/repair protein RecF [Clostridia bacterium]
MRIKGLELHRFRNYLDLELCPEPGLNVLTGLNAEGKTNVLESIFLCALGRSHRTPHDAELLMDGQPDGSVALALDTRGGSRTIRIELIRGDRKRVYLDEAPLSRSGELMGCLNVVMFSPEDLQLVKDGPQERRRFLDMELSQLKPAYYYTLQQYNQALKSRNLLLKEESVPYDMIELWDEQLSKLGAMIMQNRAAFVEELSNNAHTLHAKMSGTKEILETVYQPTVPVQDFDALRETLTDQLAERLERDVFRGFTSVGPHRDDLGLFLNGRDLRIYGSQGQQRTAALSLKLSEIDLVRRVRGERPVLLLDDVFSELDAERQARLLEVVSDCQTFVTCTHLEEFVKAGAMRMQVYRVSNGRVVEE